MSDMTKPDICIYHGNCADGFGAAWAVWKRWGDTVDYFPGFYGAEPPQVAGKNVLLVDFSYKAPVLHAMAAVASTVVILDHHKTAQADLASLPPPLDGPYDPNTMLHWQRECNAPASIHALFDMERSGAQIAWDYLHPNQPRPLLLDYVGDRDLWRFKLPRSREVNAVIFSHPYDFKVWDGLAHDLVDDAGYWNTVASGEAIERKHFKDIAELLALTRRKMRIGGHEVEVANLPYTMSSDAAGILAEGKPFGACYFDRNDGARVFSLRSREGGVDVSAIAKTYGGGGHAQAAGFQAPAGWEGEAS